MHNKDSILGQLIIGVVGSAIVGIGGFFLGKAVAPPVPPVAAISPAAISVSAGELVEFSAAGSTSTYGEITEYIWKVGGHPAAESSVGFCQTKAQDNIAICQFVLPGTFSVSVDVLDGTGITSTAVSPITVSLPNGYVGLILFVDADKEVSDQIYRLFLAAFDWQRIQRSVSRPIVIYDPDKQAPVFASSVPYVEDALAALDTSIFAGAKLIIPTFLPRGVRDELQSTVEELGGSAQIIQSSEVDQSIQSGMARSGITGFSSPEDYLARVSK